MAVYRIELAAKAKRDILEIHSYIAGCMILEFNCKELLI